MGDIISNDSHGWKGLQMDSQIHIISASYAESCFFKVIYFSTLNFKDAA